MQMALTKIGLSKSLGCVSHLPCKVHFFFSYVKANYLQSQNGFCLFMKAKVHINDTFLSLEACFLTSLSSNTCLHGFLLLQ